jgi:DNA-directed RNA polymerase subunit E'/Rpb7
MAAEKEEKKIYGVYNNNVFTKKIILSMNEVGKNLKQNLEIKLSSVSEGKCIPEGYIKQGSIKILTYSSGNVLNGNIEFQTVYECMVCYPVEGQLVECKTKAITKAGIHAEVIDSDGNVPIVIFVARDYHFTNKEFADVKEGDKLLVSIIGISYNLNDDYITATASLR